ncbi:MAG: hypothetical protein ABWY00_19085 [Dongiaceae bacterium]
MLPKFMPDLFQPIMLPVHVQRSWAHVMIRLGYPVCRRLQRQAAPANDN